MNKIIITIIFFASAVLAFSQEEADLDLTTKCGTSRFNEHQRHPKVNQILTNENNSLNTSNFYISPSKKFKINYYMSGVDAVEDVDLNQNGVPDYIDSVAYYFDYVDSIEVGVLGNVSPSPDDGFNGGPEYDILVFDLGNDDYASYGLCSPNGPVLPPKIFPRNYSFITIDNNYSPLDRKPRPDGTTSQTYTTTGIMGLKVTAAHEYFHAVQFMYGGSQNDIGSINEMTSVYMENRCFPESRDYLQYVRDMFRNFKKYPFGDGDPNVGYAYGIYYHYITSKFGEEIIKRQLQLAELGLYKFDALDSSLRKHNSSLTETWDEFLTWVYYTGSRAIEGKYFKDAAIFPDIKFTFTDEIRKNENFEISGQLLPYEIRPLRYTIGKDNIFETPDTLDFIISNTDFVATQRQLMELSDFRLVYPDLSHSYKKLCDEYYLITSSRSFTDTSFCHPGYITEEIAPGTEQRALPEV